MSKALTKRPENPPSNNNARVIETSLAVIRRSQHERAALCPEVFDLYCVCAVHDRPYTLRFERQASGRLRLNQSIKGKPSSQPDNARAGDIGCTLKLEYFENGPTPCAWCGNGSFHHCRSSCGALVCGGRMVGETFHCRNSCGASWVGTPLHEVKGQPNTPSLTVNPSQRSLSVPRQRLISDPRLMLPAAKTGGQ